MYLEDLDKNKYTLIEADNPNYQYMGRIDFENTKAPTIIYAGSMIKTKFTGSSIKVAIKNIHACYENAIGFIIDGDITGKAVIEEHNKDIILDIAEGLSEGVHDLILFKRSDAAHYFDFYGIILEKGCHLETPEPKSNKRED